MAIKKLLRKDLKQGQLYYCRRKYYKKDYLIVWELGPHYNNRTSKRYYDVEVDYSQCISYTVDSISSKLLNFLMVKTTFTFNFTF